MYLFNTIRADQVRKEDIDRLIDGRIRESVSLDYKRDIKIDMDEDAEKFIIDICAMYNTDGGCIVYGIDEEVQNGRKTGIPSEIKSVTIENFDKFQQKIEDRVKSNTDPKITRLFFKLLETDEGELLVIGIPKNLGLPSMVTIRGNNRYYRRRNTGNYVATTQEIFEMIMQTANLKNEVEKFRRDRLEDRVNKGVIPGHNLTYNSALIIHVIPFSFSNEFSIDLSEMKIDKLRSNLETISDTSTDFTYNKDGFLRFSQKAGYLQDYTQVFRNGCIETCSVQIFEDIEGGLKSILGIDIIRESIRKLLHFFEYLISKEISFPYYVGISLLEIKNRVLQSDHQYQPFNIKNLILPLVVIEEFNCEHIYERLKPIFDIIWQSVGKERAERPPLNIICK